MNQTMKIAVLVTVFILATATLAFAQETAADLIRKAHAVLEYLPIEQQPALRELATYMAERNA